MPRTSSWNPEAFDNELRKRGHAGILASLPGDSLDRQILWARAALAADYRPKMQRACQLLETSTDLLARGVYAAIISQVGEHEEVLALPLPVAAKSRRDHDGLAWLHLARSTSFAALGRNGDALLELGRGIAAAETAQMPSRAQLLRHHARVIENRLGIGNPQVIEEDLREAMPDQRRKWHSQNLAQAYLQKGEYRRAAMFSSSDGVYHQVALALTGVEEPRNTPHRSLSMAAARTWEAAWHGRAVPRVTGLGQSIVGIYASLAYGFDLSRTVEGAALVEGVIGVEPPAQADLAVLWAGVGLQAMARGAGLADPLGVPAVLNDALRRLTSTDDVMAVLVRLMPEAVLIASVAPGAHHELQLAAHGLMRRTSVTTEHVVAAYAQKNVPNHPKRSPNFGAVLVALEQLIETAGDQEREGLEAHWRLTREGMLFDYGGRWVLPGIITGAYHCNPGATSRTLEA